MLRSKNVTGMIFEKWKPVLDKIMLNQRVDFRKVRWDPASIRLDQVLSCEFYRELP